MGENLQNHVVSSGDWGAEFRCTPSVLDAFKRRKIHLGFEAPYTGQEVLRFEKGVLIEPYASFSHIRAYYTLWSMDAFSFSPSPWPTGVHIGRYCSIAKNCTTIRGRHPIEWATSSTLVHHMSAGRGENPWVTSTHLDFNGGPFESGPIPVPPEQIDIDIEHDVWLGLDVCLGHRVRIGTGSVIATRAVVTHDVAPYMVVGGVPARVIRPRFTESIIEKLLESRWWEYAPDLWKVCDYKNPERFIDDVARVRETGALKPYTPAKITFSDILSDLEQQIADQHNNL